MQIWNEFSNADEDRHSTEYAKSEKVFIVTCNERGSNNKHASILIELRFSKKQKLNQRINIRRDTIRE